MARKLNETLNQARDRLSALSELAESVGQWKPATQVIRKIEAVPTIFPKYDQVVGIGGNPVGRLMLVHGPSNEGKSAFCLGLGLSYLERGHVFAFADAERTASVEWLQSYASGYINHPGFLALPVSTYESTRADVRRLCDRMSEMRLKGKLPDDATGLIVIDSIRKLVPEDIWKKLTAELGEGGAKRRGGKVGLDGYGGRGAQIKAAMNSAWVDELIPLLANSRMTMAIVAREHEEELNDFLGRTKINVGGGDALKYDSSLMLRISRDWIHDGEGQNKRLIGEKHLIQVFKTKVAKKSESVPEGYFHTSNGTVSPFGFDRIRDLFEMARELAIITNKASYFYYGNNPLGQGAQAAMDKLRTSDLHKVLEEHIRDRLKDENSKEVE